MLISFANMAFFAILSVVLGLGKMSILNFPKLQKFSSAYFSDSVYTYLSNIYAYFGVSLDSVTETVPKIESSISTKMWRMRE